MKSYLVQWLLSIKIESVTRIQILDMAICVVYWPSTRPNMPFQSDAPEGSDTFRWQLWEEITLAGLAENLGQGKIPWYTHRLMHRKRVTCELHDNFSAWWRSNIPFQRLSGRWNYYITRWRQEVRELETRCGRESHHPAEGALGDSRLRVGDQMSWWQDVIEKASRKLSPQASGWASGERERHNADGHKSGGVNILQFCSVSNTLSHTQPFQIKWEVYFFKEVFTRHLFIASICILHVYVYSCSIWLYNICICLNF